ncbi:glycosyltransferase family 2 protein [Oceanobacillus kimchii]|uniref:glycosyltransferase family 2 protein n=1 Tax=Oceanobacillus kimchii TaxID=746691 RepID=UPI0003495662|nr:glycosyltransferase family 2 protein [Oceanobacillus kimchii]
MISIITCTNRDHMMENIFQNYISQSLDNKELIIILNNDSINIDTWLSKAANYSNVSVFQMPEWNTASECKMFASQQASYDYIAKFDDDDYYAPNYLESIWSIYQNNKQVDIIGKSSVYVYFQKSNFLGILHSNKENQYTNRVVDSTLTFKKEVLSKVSFIRCKYGSDAKFQKDCIYNGYKIYSIDRFNHVIFRNESHNQHTWKITDKQLMDACTDLICTNDFKTIIHR